MAPQYLMNDSKFGLDTLYMQVVEDVRIRNKNVLLVEKETSKCFGQDSKRIAVRLGPRARENQRSRDSLADVVSTRNLISDNSFAHR